MFIRLCKFVFLICNEPGEILMADSLILIWHWVVRYIQVDNTLFLYGLYRLLIIILNHYCVLDMQFQSRLSSESTYGNSEEAHCDCTSSG